MTYKQPVPKSLRISDEDWKMLELAARVQGIPRNKLIVDASKRAALSTLTGALVQSVTRSLDAKRPRRAVELRHRPETAR